MKKLAIAAIVVASLAVATSGAALWRTRDLSKSSNVNTTDSSGLVDVPDETGNSAFAAGGDLTNLKLKFKLVRVASATVPERNVISQNPAPGTQVPEGTEVELTVSNGPAP